MTIQELIAAQPMFVVVIEFFILIGVFLSTVGAGVRWLVKHYFEEMKAELKPNSGSSLKDQVTRLEQQHEKLEGKIDDLYDKLIEYLANGNKGNTRSKKN